MDATSTKIPAWSQRQAMDWSLVLASQGIECAIARAEDGAGWELDVPIADYERAMEAIRLYRLENRRWPWRREVLRPGLLFDWGALAWVLLIVLFFSLQGVADLESGGRMDSVAVGQGQWWRLFTAIWLHADFDVAFINHELRRIDGVPHQIRDCCGVLDTLALARRMHHPN